MNDDEALDRLREAGFAIDGLEEEQTDVLRDLSEEEVDMLIDVRTRLVESGADTEAHAAKTIGGLFF